MTDYSLSPMEWLLLSASAALSLGMILNLYRKGDQVTFWSPPLFMAAIYLYYVVIGPALSLMVGDGLDRLVDMRPYYLPAWGAAFVGLASWCMGYYISSRRSRRAVPTRSVQINFVRLWRMGMLINVIALLAFVITSGLQAFRMINPLAALELPAGAGYSGPFANYFSLCINLFVLGCAILLLARLRGYGNWPLIIAWTAVAAGIYISIGFRYRLVLLSGAILFVYYLEQRRRPNLVLLGCLATVFVIAMGVIGNTRSYGRGLDLSRDQRTLSESFMDGFGEAGIFATSGAVIYHVPADRPFVGFEPVKQTLLMPIPTRLYNEKATDAYMVETLMTIYGEKVYVGAAYMFFAEFYQMFWWPGLVLAHLALGWMYGLLWVWYRRRPNEPFAILVYATAVPYLYWILSRGYLPLVAAVSCYSVLPAFLLYTFSKAFELKGQSDPNRALAYVRK